jgi:hypothetical protein
MNLPILVLTIMRPILCCRSSRRCPPIWSGIFSVVLWRVGDGSRDLRSWVLVVSALCCAR